MSWRENLHLSHQKEILGISDKLSKPHLHSHVIRFCCAWGKNYFFRVCTDQISHLQGMGGLLFWVNIGNIWPDLVRRYLTCFLATSTASSDSQPYKWVLECGFPNCSVMKGSIESSTLGSMGVVACISRYRGVPLKRIPFFSMMSGSQQRETKEDMWTFSEFERLRFSVRFRYAYISNQTYDHWPVIRWM
jgi:hypothetical protein